MTTYRITHDPQSGAFYIRLREGDYHETIPLGGLGAGVDVDADGNVLGLEFLSFEEFAEVIADHNGALVLPDQMRFEAASDYPPDSERLREARASLPDRYREVLELFYLKGLSASEVADRLGTSVAFAYRLRQTAIRSVRVALEQGQTGIVDDADLEASLSKL